MAQRTDFSSLQDGARITLYPQPDNPLHCKPVAATYQSGFFYCDGTPPEQMPDYCMRDITEAIAGFDFLESSTSSPGA